MRLALKALEMSSDSMPNIFVDTTGCAFTYVVARILFACKVIAYVHYPTISTDMLNLVWERRRSAYNHQEYISRSQFTTIIKLIYYTIFAVLYGMVGSLASLVLVNSTWTCNHIRSLWKWAAWSNRIKIVFPPCPVLDLQKNDILKKREPAILSIGQFRPEKDHVLQIESFATLLERHPELKPSTKLILIGSCRGPDDEARLELLNNLTEKLGLSDSVSFVVNQRYSVIVDWLQRASVGIHTVRLFWRQTMLRVCHVSLISIARTPPLDVERTLWNRNRGNDGRWLNYLRTQFGWSKIRYCRTIGGSKDCLSRRHC